MPLYEVAQLSLLIPSPARRAGLLSKEFRIVHDIFGPKLPHYSLYVIRLKIPGYIATFVFELA